jgi:hypothetical protein
MPFSSRSESRSRLSSTGSEYEFFSTEEHYHTVRDEAFEVDPEQRVWQAGSRHNSAVSVASQQSDASSRPIDPMLYSFCFKTSEFNKKLINVSEPRLHVSPPIAPPRVRRVVAVAPQCNN